MLGSIVDRAARSSFSISGRVGVDLVLASFRRLRVMPATFASEVPDDFISRFGITGSVGYCVDRLGELISTGLDRVVLLTGSRDGDREHTAASVERLSKDVLPQLR